jgi:hypothetical protein
MWRYLRKWQGRDWHVAEVADVFTRRDRQHPWRVSRGLNVDPGDPRRGIGRPGERNVQQLGWSQVFDVCALARQKPRILDAAYRLTC